MDIMSEAEGCLTSEESVVPLVSFCFFEDSFREREEDGVGAEGLLGAWEDGFFCLS